MTHTGLKPRIGRLRVQAPDGSLILILFSGLNPFEDILLDTIKSCFCIMGRSSINGEEYPAYADGITRIHGHIFSGTFNGEWTGVRAASVLYISSAILIGLKVNISAQNENPEFGDINKVKHIQRI